MILIKPHPGAPISNDFYPVEIICMVTFQCQNITAMAFQDHSDMERRKQ